MGKSQCKQWLEGVECEKEGTRKKWALGEMSNSFRHDCGGRSRAVEIEVRISKLEKNYKSSLEGLRKQYKHSPRPKFFFSLSFDRQKKSIQNAYFSLVKVAQLLTVTK